MPPYPRAYIYIYIYIYVYINTYMHTYIHVCTIHVARLSGTPGHDGTTDAGPRLAESRTFRAWAWGWTEAPPDCARIIVCSPLIHRAVSAHRAHHLTEAEDEATMARMKARGPRDGDEGRG